MPTFWVGNQAAATRNPHARPAGLGAAWRHRGKTSLGKTKPGRGRGAGRRDPAGHGTGTKRSRGTASMILIWRDGRRFQRGVADRRLRLDEPGSQVRDTLPLEFRSSNCFRQTNLAMRPCGPIRRGGVAANPELASSARRRVFVLGRLRSTGRLCARGRLAGACAS